MIKNSMVPLYQQLSEKIKQQITVVSFTIEKKV